MCLTLMLVSLFSKEAATDGFLFNKIHLSMSRSSNFKAVCLTLPILQTVSLLDDMRRDKLFTNNK